MKSSKGGTSTRPSITQFPWAKGKSKLVAMHMSSLGYARLGVGFVLQAHTGLRPAELLALVPRDILFPEDQGRRSKDMPASIALGTEKGIKVKRPQFVLLDHRIIVLNSSWHCYASLYE